MFQSVACTSAALLLSQLCGCLLLPVAGQVWDWLSRLSPDERCWIYTPKAERAAGIVEGLKGIIADKLAAQQERQHKAQQRALSPGGQPPVRALRG